MGWGSSDYGNFTFRSDSPFDSSHSGQGEESDNFGGGRSSEAKNALSNTADTVKGSPGLLLSASSAVGAGSVKVSKKRSRASRRPPTTVLEADSSNFRNMVQQLTGIPTPPPTLFSPPLHTRFNFLSGTGLLRPQPTRLYDTGISHQGVYTTSNIPRIDDYDQRLRNYMHPGRGLFPNSVHDKPLSTAVPNGNVYGHQGGTAVWDDNARVKREEAWSRSL